MTPEHLQALPRVAQDVVVTALDQGRVVLISLSRTGACRFPGPDFQRLSSSDDGGGAL